MNKHGFIGLLLALFLATERLQAQNYAWTTIAGQTNTPAFADGTNTAALFNNPQGVVADGVGNIFVADANNFVLRKISLVGTNWVTTTIAGLPGAKAYLDGTNNTVRFNVLTTLQMDGAGNLYVQDFNSPNFYIRKISPVGTNWVVTTIYKLWAGASGWACDPTGNYYTASNYAIIQLSPVITNGIPSATNFLATTLAGAPGLTGYTDGSNNVARFYTPNVFSIDSSGTIYLSDATNVFQGGSTYRKVTPIGTNYVTTTTSLQLSLNGTKLFPTSLPLNSLDYAGNILGSFLLAFDNYYHLLQVPVGASSAAFLGGLTNTTLAGITAGPDGKVYLADNGASLIRQGSATNLPLGALQVSLQPNGALTNGTAWRVDAGLWQTNGAAITNLIAGSNHILTFAPVFGWTSPSNQWVTIASNLTTTVAGNYLPQFGSLQVNLTPAAATNAGAQWQLDNGSWQSSGTIVSNVPVGNHTVSFTNLAGYITPAAQTNVSIAWNQTTITTGNYVLAGSIQVTIAPTNAVTLGAQWSLDNGPFQNSGVTVSNVTPTTHTISYSPLNSWITPTNQAITVVSGQATNVSATYTALGSLQVLINPVGLISLGAVWRVDGAAWQASGGIVTNLTAGPHIVSFTNIFGWSTPTNQTVTINLNQTTVTTGVYVQQFGNVKVVLSPAGAVSSGAQWQIDGGVWQSSGATLTNLIIGSHALAFANVPGWTPPTNQSVTIVFNQTAQVTGIYSGQGSLQVLLLPANAISAGALWQVDNGNWLTNGTTVANLNRGTHTVNYKTASGWVTPASQTVTIIANQLTLTNGLYNSLGYSFTTIAGAIGTSGFVDGTNLTALFSTPIGMVVDANTNIFIADTGNSVIRKLSPLTNGWVSSTIAGLANNPGNSDGTNSQARFDYPTGLALDTNGALYVADQVNSTIRRLTTDGTNWMTTTIAGLAGSYGNANGTNSGARFYYPTGLAVDPSGNVFVSDQINSIIRKITPLGSNNWATTTIAGSSGLNGSADGLNNSARFYWPGDMKSDASGNLYVADTGNNTIRKITLSGANYVITTIAGAPGVNGSQDGTNSGAWFDGLGGLALDSLGNLFVADSYSSTIRKITPVGNNWVVNTIGGLAYNSGATDGVNALAHFNMPYGVCVDANGVVYVADTYNQIIRAGTTSFFQPVIPNIILVSAGTNFAFNWQAAIGLNYQVQYKTNLLQTTWINLGPTVSATNSVMPFVEANSKNGQRFYRVVQP